MYIILLVFRLAKCSLLGADRLDNLDTIHLKMNLYQKWYY